MNARAAGLSALILAILAALATVLVLLNKSGGSGGAPLLQLPARFHLTYTLQSFASNDTYAGDLFVDGNFDFAHMQSKVVAQFSDGTDYIHYVNKGYAAFTSSTLQYNISCVDASSLPPVGTSGDAISSISPMSLIEMMRGWGADLVQLLDMECKSVNGVWMHMVFAQTEYGLCIANGMIHRVAGEDFILRVTTFNAHPTTDLSAVFPAEMTTQCTSMLQDVQEREIMSAEKDRLLREELTSSSSFFGAPQKQKLSSFIAYGLSRHPRHQNTVASLFSSEDLQGYKKTKCVFLHGLGASGEGDKGFDPYYWQEARNVAKAYCQYIYMPIYDTLQNRPDQPYLMNAYADWAAKAQGPNDIVFAHSMGNVILANACAKLGRCNYWYGLAGPFAGSTLSNLAYAALCPSDKYSVANAYWSKIQGASSLFCNAATKFFSDNFSVPALLTHLVFSVPCLFNALDFVKIFKCSPANYALHTCNWELQSDPNSVPSGVLCNAASYVNAAKYLKGNLCGDSSGGLISSQTIVLPITHLAGRFYTSVAETPFKCQPTTFMGMNFCLSDNLVTDGLVTTRSCNWLSAIGQGYRDFNKAPDTINKNRASKDKFATMALNHVDLMFHSTDGWWGEDRKPISWLKKRFEEPR